MKSLQNLALLLLTGAMFSACSDAAGIEEQIILPDETVANSELSKTRSSEGAELTFEQVKAYLDQCGYDTTTLTEHEEYYLIDSDMGFNKERLAQEINETSPRMVYTSLLDKEHYRLNLNLIPFEYTDTQQFVAAVTEWNNIGNCSLNFTSATLNNSPSERYNINVEMQPDPYGPGAYPNMIYVEAPTKGRPGNRIIINTNTKLWKEIDATQRKYAIMHALGHLVGCNHYDFFGNHYPNTAPDPSTIMLAESELAINKSLWQGFTGHDLNALREMYPLKPATHSIPARPKLQVPTNS